MHAPIDHDAANRQRAGLFYGLGAYFAWGLLPLYFKALGHVGTGEILGQRILWSLALLMLLVAIGKRWTAIRAAISDRRVLLALTVSSLLIGINWLVYIFAVLTGHILEGSLGYYLNPLVSIFIGVAFLGERLSRAQVGATILAGVGVAILAVGAGTGLWISLTLALSFAAYGYIRKITPVEPLSGLAIETMLLAPFAIGWLVWIEIQGTGGFGRLGVGTDLMLVLGGAITAVPLLLFTAAAKRLPLSMLGFLQYIAPSLQFLMAVLLFGERLTFSHILCFAAIWTALAIFTIDGVRRTVVRRRAEGLA